MHKVLVIFNFPLQLKETQMQECKDKIFVQVTIANKKKIANNKGIQTEKYQ